MLRCDRSAGSRVERRPRVGRVLVVGGVLAVVLTITGCGGDDDGAASSSATTTTVADSSTATSSDSTNSESPASDAAATDATQPDVTDPAPLSTMTPGDITETVPAGEVQDTAAPVDIDETATFPGSVSATITSITSVETDASLPGEIAGPGVAIAMEFENGSTEPLDLSSVVVDLVDADGLSATPINNGTEPFSGTLDAGATQPATYVFTIDESLRRDVTIRLSYSAHQPIVLFTGDIA